MRQEREGVKEGKGYGKEGMGLAFATGVAYSKEAMALQQQQPPPPAPQARNGNANTNAHPFVIPPQGSFANGFSHHQKLSKSLPPNLNPKAQMPQRKAHDKIGCLCSCAGMCQMF